MQLELPRGQTDFPQIIKLGNKYKYLSMDDVERLYILRTIRRCGGNKTAASKMLGIQLKTIYNKLNRYKREGKI